MMNEDKTSTGTNRSNSELTMTRIIVATNRGGHRIKKRGEDQK
jgi:hypothetical protein